jgi:hypothetical protein
LRRDLVRLDGDGFEGTERLLDRTSLHQKSVVHGLCLQLGAQHLTGIKAGISVRFNIPMFLNVSFHKSGF